MDDQLRHLQRDYQRGELTTLQWLIALRRAGYPYQQELLQHWLQITAPVENLSVSEEYHLLRYLLELLHSFPLQCTCRICPGLSSGLARRRVPPEFTFCECVITGVCVSADPARVCPTCRSGCVADFGDRLWTQPGQLAVGLEEPKFGVGTRPFCKGYHYEGTVSSGDDMSYETGSLGVSPTRDKMIFILRHAVCRYEPDVPEEDDETREWRNMLGDLGPGEFPPG